MQLDRLGCAKKKAYVSRDKNKLKETASLVDKIKESTNFYYLCTYGHILDQKKVDMTKLSENNTEAMRENFTNYMLELIACALKGELGEARESIYNLEMVLKHDKHFDGDLEQTINVYLKGLQKNLEIIGLRQIEFLNKLEKLSIKTHSRYLFLKMKADIYRYLASDAENNSNKEKYIARADHWYFIAMETAIAEELFLQDHGEIFISPITLGIFLNYAIFKFNNQSLQKDALRMLKEVIREALDNFDHWGIHVKYQLDEEEFEKKNQKEVKKVTL